MVPSTGPESPSAVGTPAASSPGPMPYPAKPVYQANSSAPAGVMRANRPMACAAHWISCRPVRPSA